MTDTKATVELPPCGRRCRVRTLKDEGIVCRPPRKRPDIPLAELIQDPRWFRSRRVTCVDCLRCTQQEPVETPVPSPRPSKTPEEYKNPPRLLEDGTIIYEHETWEPPPVPPGYRRKSNDLRSPGAWTMVPEKPLCKRLRLIQVRKEGCGCIRVDPVCTLNDEIVSHGQCAKCPHREYRSG